MKSATDRELTTPAGLTPHTIAAVKDFTARKTLEQAYAFTRGLTEALHNAPREEESKGLAQALTSAGISLADAEQIAAEGLALIAVMAERDRRAEAFHAAVRDAGDGERALYDRLSSFARLLRMKLGPTSPSLASFGVPVADSAPPPRARSRSTWPASLDSAATK